MPSYTPLRRISLALRLSKPYQTHSTPKPDNLARFLSESKEKYLNDVRATPGRGGEWTVVMGNEAGGIDFYTESWTRVEHHTFRP
jgi:exopolyphosphatase